MTRPDPAPEPTVDTALLAALDAGLLHPDRAGQVRAAAEADARAAAVLDALAATRAELQALPAPPVPPHFAARWAAALDNAALDNAALDNAGLNDAGAGAAVGPATAETPSAVGRDGLATTGRDTTGRGHAVPARPRGRSRDGRHPRTSRSGAGSTPRRLRAPLAAATVVALLAVLFGVGVLGAGPAEPDLPVTSRLELAGLARAAVGVRDLGALADPARRAGCLRAVAPAGLAPDTPVLGGRQVLLDGQRGVLLVLAAGTLGALRLVVVDPACGPAGGALLDDVVIGG